MVFIVGLTWILFRAIIYYGYQGVGIVYTTSLIILSPVLMLIFAVVFLKERPTARQIVSNGVILACVVASVLLR